MDLLERAPALDHLHTLFRESASGRGHLVFVSGEMGIGKTSLIDRFTDDVSGRARRIDIPFDGLSIPAPLGPLFDVGRQLGTDVESQISIKAPRALIFRAVEADLRTSREPTVVVAEDAHWSDEASLDLLRFLGRRIGDLPALVVVTFRDDELPIDHPLRRVIGDLATVPAVHRIVLAPLTIAAVTELAKERDVDPLELHAYTGGNPFFVSEILASGSRVPISLRDAILGRAARLTPDDRAVIEAAATIGTLVDADILRCVLGRSIEHAVERALAVGLLRPDEAAIAFRHAAVQSVLVDATSSVRRRDLHRCILACLEDHPDFSDDVSRLAFHAEAAGDQAAALRYAIAAASRSTAFQSHREAADQYARALRHAGAIPPSRRAELLEARAYASYLTARMDDAIVAQESAAAFREQSGQRREYGYNIRRLSRFYDFAGRHDDAERLAQEAYATLESFPESSEFALACGYLAEWRLRAGATDEAIALAERAMSIANLLEDDSTTAHALITVGMTRLSTGDDGGRAFLEKGLDLARRAGNEEFVLRALRHLAAPPGSRLTSVQALPYITEGLAYAHEHDLATKIVMFGSMHLRRLLDRGEWANVIAESDQLLTHPPTTGHYVLDVHVARGLARLRCGQATANEFDRAMELDEALDGGAHPGAVAAALAEAAWLDGDDERAGTIAAAGLDAALAASDTWMASELALWIHRAGQLDGELPWIVFPFAHEIRGDRNAAAESWLSLDMPLEAARARSASTDPSDLRDALVAFERLGARPDATRVKRRLRELGVRTGRRGPHSSTRATYGSLTRREVEILGLLSTGATNRTIAARLSLSPKTIDHHVSAILGKLRVPNRQQAVNRARDVGLIPEK